MKVYISGKISGLNHDDAFENFQRAAKQVKALGHDPVNPMEIVGLRPDWGWSEYIVEDMKLLLQCRGIYLQKNWTDSMGARIERAVAVETRMTIIYEN